MVPILPIPTNNNHAPSNRGCCPRGKQGWEWERVVTAGSQGKQGFVPRRPPQLLATIIFANNIQQNYLDTNTTNSTLFNKTQPTHMGQLDIQYSFETSLLWRFKLHLQKTGWLQYMPPFIVGVFFIISSHVLEQLLLLLLRTSTSYLIPGVLFILSSTGKLLLAIGIFDIVTLKFNIRPFTESIPNRPTSIDNNENDDLCSIMQQRHSCRSFQPRRILDKDREELLQVASIASKDILGSSSSIRFEYVNSPLKVWPTVGAREFLVAIGPAKYDRMAMMDVGRSLQRVVIHATKMGIATSG